MRFFVGLHQPSDAQYVPDCMISVNRLRRRLSDFVVGDWLMDSGAFTELARYGYYRFPPEEYAEQVKRWSKCGNLLTASTQDYMVEPAMLERRAELTGVRYSVSDHQKATIQRYDELYLLIGEAAYLMPVLQGQHPQRVLPPQN